MNAKRKRAVLVGIDGLVIEQLERLDTPHFRQLHMKKSYIGGDPNGSKHNTDSGPGWATILTGTWPSVHGIPDSTYRKPAKAPSVFNFLKKAYPEQTLLLIPFWTTIYTHIKDRGDIDLVRTWESSEKDVEYLTSQIKNESVLFSFIHIDELDAKAHRHGFGRQYDNAIIWVDQLLGKIMQAVNIREREHAEDWLVLVTTDHGHIAKGGHGGHSLLERTCFIAMNQMGNERFKGSYNGVISTEEQLYQTLPQTAIAPTILSWFSGAGQNGSLLY